MGIVVLTAFAVGGATALGVVLGICCRSISRKFQHLVMSFAAGVMLSAAILGLILPAAQRGGIWVTVVGIFSGALCLSFIDRIPARLAPNHRTEELDRALLFVTAIAIHNFPEGLAAGVSFGTGDIPQALLIAGGIALQNIPEGVVTVTPLLAAGMSPWKALVIGVLTGVVEILGTLFGCWAVSLTQSLLPFLLAFAGGTMLYVICDEMIPETHPSAPLTTYFLLTGFCLMMISDLIL